MLMIQVTHFVGVMNDTSKFTLTHTTLQRLKDQQVLVLVKDYVTVGYRGSNPFDVGLFYCPYVPLQ